MDTEHRPPPYTVIKLSRLRPGERFVYYRGDFKEDIEQAEAEAPNYAKALRQIRDAAFALAARGQITLKQETRSLTKHARGSEKGRLRYFEYIAIGA